MKKLKPLDYKILSELMKNAKSSDRQIAKKLRVSQPTVTRRRAILEKEAIDGYAAIPKLEKLGFEILAFNFARWKPQIRVELMNTQEFLKKGRDFLSKHPNTLFVSSGYGEEGDSISITVHRNYADYSEYLRSVRTEWAEYLLDISSFLINIKGNEILRKFTFKHLADYIEKET